MPHHGGLWTGCHTPVDSRGDCHASVVSRRRSCHAPVDSGRIATPRWSLEMLAATRAARITKTERRRRRYPDRNNDTDATIGTTDGKDAARATRITKWIGRERERETDRRTTTPMPRSERHRCHDRDDRHSGQHCNYTTTPHITMQLERDHVITNFIHYGLIKRSHVITKHTTIMQHIGSCVMTNGYGRSAPSRPSEDSLARPSRQASAPEPTAANAARIAASGYIYIYT